MLEKEPLKPVEITGLVPLLEQAGIDNLREWGPCDCHGSKDCPHCGGSNVRERVIRVFMVDGEASMHFIQNQIDVHRSSIRFRAHKGLHFAVVVDH